MAFCVSIYLDVDGSLSGKVAQLQESKMNEARGKWQVPSADQFHIHSGSGQEALSPRKQKLETKGREASLLTEPKQRPGVTANYCWLVRIWSDRGSEDISREV